MSDEKTTIEEIEALNKALEAGEHSKPDSDLPDALDIHNSMNSAKKYLTPKAIKDLSKISRTITVEREDGSLASSVYFIIRTRHDNTEKGVELISGVINDLANNNLIVSALAPISCMKLARVPLQQEQSAIFCFVHVPYDKIDEIKAKHSKYWVMEGGAGECIDDLSPDLKDGEFLAEIYVTQALASKLDVEARDELLQDRIDQFLAVLPKNTAVKNVERCSAMDLCVPYEVKFYNPLLKKVKKVDIDYVRCAEAVDDKIVQFNLFLGIRYMDAEGKNLYDYQA